MNIGQVLDLLRSDFPGISIPKIRFLEDKGLIAPERTASGYRKFSPGDVERLRYVLRMQRDHYLPLKVIGDHLDAMDRGLEPPPIDAVVPTVPRVALADDGLPSAESFARRSDLRLSRKELIKTAEIDEELLAALETYGLIKPRPGTQHYDTDALVVGLVEQVVEPVRRSRDTGASARADDAVNQIAALSVKLHATLVKAGLRSS
jgi:DNA-binding transcriptional MerR regulator